jgi:membrane dipeptidase
LAAIRESQGLVGVTFATSYLRSDGGRDADTTADLILKHGEDGIGFGSDFDGAKMPGNWVTVGGQALGSGASKRPAVPR